LNLKKYHKKCYNSEIQFCSNSVAPRNLMSMPKISGSKIMCANVS
jgi:hypothetical protein